MMKANANTKALLNLMYCGIFQDNDGSLMSYIKNPKSLALVKTSFDLHKT